MTYEEMLEFLGSRLNYEQKGMPARTELRLDRTAMLLDELGRPDRNFSIVHLAGTKGKGSTAHMVAALLAAQGLRVGLHTSPHLTNLEERFRIQGVPIESRRLAELAGEVEPAVTLVDRQLQPAQPPLTFFEITTAMVLLYFARERVDWGVIEVGMGGRLDSTNVVTPDVAVITHIGLDHMQQLGGTIAAIAREKGGIIKPNRPVVSGALEPDARAVIEEIARARGAPLRQLGIDFHVESESLGLRGTRAIVRDSSAIWPPADLPVLGQHQAANFAVAAATMDVLVERGLTFDRLKGVRGLTNLHVPGRLEVVSRRPCIVLDVAHNRDSLAAMIRGLEETKAAARLSWWPRILIFGVSRDKQWRDFLPIIQPAFDHVVATQFCKNPRALPAAELVAACRDLKIDCSLTESPTEAWKEAISRLPTDHSGSEALIVVAGSFYLVAEARESLTILGTLPGTKIAPIQAENGVVAADRLQ